MPEELKDRVRRFRSENNLTQEMFGKMLGVNRLTIIRWEHNRTGMHNDTRLKVDQLFKIKRCPTCGKEI